MKEHPQILFHLGFQKTGSTSIQAMLNANQALFPDIEIRAYGDATHDLRVSGRAFCETPGPAQEHRLRTALADHVARFRASGARACLISDENILGRVPYSQSGDILRWAKAILPMIEEATVELDTICVFYTRRPDAWRRSIYGQSVKRAGVTSGFRRWVAVAPFPEGWPDWDSWLGEMRAATRLPIERLSMEEELASGDVLGTALLRRLGVPKAVLDRIAPVPAQNTALSERALLVMRAVNLLPLRRRERLRISEAVEGWDRRWRPS